MRISWKFDYDKNYIINPINLIAQEMRIAYA
jgi:hypothetical protein